MHLDLIVCLDCFGMSGLEAGPLGWLLFENFCNEIFGMKFVGQGDAIGK